MESLLRASHIKAWGKCDSGTERLDPFNGIMRSVHIDVLFDKGYISFESDGRMLISPHIDKAVVKLFGLDAIRCKPFAKKSGTVFKLASG